MQNTNNTQNSILNTQNSNLRTQNSELRTQNSELKPQITTDTMFGISTIKYWDFLNFGLVFWNDNQL